MLRLVVLNVHSLRKLIIARLTAELGEPAGAPEPVWVVRCTGGATIDVTINPEQGQQSVSVWVFDPRQEHKAMQFPIVDDGDINAAIYRIGEIARRK